jgi:perosamine synthetase
MSDGGNKPEARRVIPIYQPSLLGREREYVNECLDGNWISSKGEFITRFEEHFARHIDVGFATTVSNGTVALHLALHALGIGAGDEVIVPTLTYIASVNAIAYVGATPVFIDSCRESWNLDPEQIELKITERTKAVMVVHLYGAPCDMDPILEICRRRGLYIIEDVAEAFGSRYRGRSTGTFGDVAAFSFFGNKTITTGEGGMLVSNDEDLIRRIAYLKSQAVSPSREYWHEEIGFNYRMTNLCAAIGLAQLERAEEIIEKKRRLASWYKAELEGFPLKFQDDDEAIFNTYWMVSVVAESGLTRDAIRRHLKSRGVETRPLFHPAHTMPRFQRKESFPVAESLSAKGLNLPSYPDLSFEEVSYICEEIRSALEA